MGSPNAGASAVSGTADDRSLLMRIEKVNYRTNAMYFAKRTEFFRIVSIIFLAVGIVLMLLEMTIEFDTWAVMSAGVMLTVIGAAVYAFDNGKRVKDSELEEVVRKAVSKMPSKAEEKMAENRIKLKESSRYEFTAYEPDADGALTKKGGDGTLRSSRVSYTAVICGTADRRPCAVIYRNTFSLTDPYETDSVIRFGGDEISDVRLTEEEREITAVGGEKLDVTTAKICMTLSDGSETVFPVKNDAAADEFLSAMKRIRVKPAL